MTRNAEGSPAARWDGLALEVANLAMDLQERLVVGAADDVRNRGGRPAQLALHRQKNIHVVEDDQVFTAFQVCLHRFVLIHSARQAKGQVAGKRQCFTRLCFVVLDELPRTGHIDFEQGVDAVLPPVEVQVVMRFTT